jgi:hypothetical protein
LSTFFIHIIESPSDEDFLEGTTEGRLLTGGLSIAQIPFSYNLAVNKKMFILALTKKLSQAMTTYQRYPILHLSAHGNDNGLALTKGFFDWDELSLMLTPINTIMEGRLIVSISACSGFAGCRMAMKPSGSSPFFGILGPTEPISLADTAIGFLSFYHLLSKNTPFYDAFDAMKRASGNNHFNVITARQAKMQRDLYLKSLDNNVLAAIIKATGAFKK